MKDGLENRSGSSTKIDEDPEFVTRRELLANSTIKLEEDERILKHPTSYMETIIHFVKAGLGAGIFAMGEATSNVGLALAPVFTIFLSGVCLYEQHVLLICAADVREYFALDRIPDYGETFQLALLANEKWRKHARTMKIISNTFLILTQLGFCAVYFVFIGSTMQHVLAIYGFDFRLRVLISISLVPIWLTCLITNLKLLSMPY
jgi:proton-coupled amino acid transporter